MHPGIHEYAEKLTAKLPGDLKVYHIAGNLVEIKLTVLSQMIWRFKKYWQILIWWYGTVLSCVYMHGRTIGGF